MAFGGEGRGVQAGRVFSRQRAAEKAITLLVWNAEGVKRWDGSLWIAVVELIRKEGAGPNADSSRRVSNSHLLFCLCY